MKKWHLFALSIFFALVGTGLCIFEKPAWGWFLFLFFVVLIAADYTDDNRKSK